MEEQQMNKSNPQAPLRRRIFRWVRKGLLLLVGFILITTLLFQIPAVQTWAARQATRFLSKELQTTVKIDRISLLFLNRFELHHFYLEDYSRDTLLYSHSLKIDLSINPFAWAKNGIQVNKLELEQAQLNWVRRVGQVESDFEKILDQLFPRKEKKGKPLHLKLNRLSLYDVDFRKEDLVKGSLLHIYLSEGQILMDTFDLPDKKIMATGVHLVEPLIEIENYPSVPLPDSLQALLPERNTKAPEDSTFFEAGIDRLTLSGGTFRLHNYRKDPVKMTPDSILDYRHMDVYDIGIGIDDFRWKDNVFTGSVDAIRFRDKSGFILDRLSAKAVTVSSETVTLDGLLIETPQSRISNFFQMNYSAYTDFSDFVNRVRMRGDLTNTRVSLSDILVFAPGLGKNRFFASNQNEVIRISGSMSGSVNRLRARNLNVQLADSTIIRGRFSTNDITVRGEERLNVRLDELKTKMQTLRDLIPGLRLPINFNQLGNLAFEGSYDGFFEDFVANGLLKTNIGEARLDMRMNLVPGRELAEYSGELALLNFDLGTWTGDPNLGFVNVSSRVVDGIGLTAATAVAELEANVASLEYKGYRYENARVSGVLNQNRFDGSLNIQDDNIDFSFDGKADLNTGVPEFDFQADIRRLDLLQLNLSKEEYLISGRVKLDVKETDPAKMQGTISLVDFLINTPQEELRVDSLALQSSIGDDGHKVYQLDGNLLSGRVEGLFNIVETPAVFSNLLHQNFPDLAQRIGLKSDSLTRPPQSFTYDLSIPSSGGFEKLVSPKLGALDDTRVKGYLDSEKDSLLIDLEIPRLQLDSIVAYNTVVILDLIEQEGGLDFAVDSVYINPAIQLGQTVLLSFITGDAFLFGINSEEPFSSKNKRQDHLVDNVNLNGSFMLTDTSGFRIEFDDSDVFLFQKRWQIDPDNYLQFGKNTFKTQNFFMTNGVQLLEMADLQNTGLHLRLLDIDLDYLNDVLNYEPLQFDGNYEVDLKIQDVFNLKGLTVNLEAPSFILNEEDRGRLDFYAEAPDVKSRMDIDFALKKGNQAITSNGFFNLADLGPEEDLPPEQQAGYFDLSATLINFPAKVGGYFIANIVEDMTGKVNAKTRLYGLPQKPNISGLVNMNDVAFTVSYLQTRYRLEQGAEFRIDNQFFDGTGNKLYDVFGHQAALNGGIRHQNLKNFRLDVNLDIDRMQAMNTTAQDNDMFYGHALGTGTIQFSGPFKKPNLYIFASVGDSSQLTIPLNRSAEEAQVNFVEFVDQDEVKARQEKSISQTVELKGLEIEMDLQILPEAVVEIVFDQQAGDVLRGSGRGNLQINVTRDGLFTMFGNYNISKGSYLFTLYNVVNKQFTIKEGGVIQFTGDPLNAQLNVKAEYRSLSTSVANFIQEYLQVASSDLKNDASKSTRVILEMALSGPLEKPIINFDIFFPDLTGELANLTDSKMRVLRRDQNEMNRQVFGLIVAGQFLPTDLNIQGTEIFYNTVSEFLSNQLSMLLTGLFSEIISEGKVLSGIDIDVAYSSYQAADLGEGQDYTSGNEFQVRLRQDFFNDRLSVIVGGNIDVGGNITAPDANNGTFVGNDLVIEYAINKDRTLKLRVYQRLQPDIGGGRRLQVGTGLSFRKEFDNFGEFLRSIGQKKRNRKQEKKQEQAEKEEVKKGKDLLGSKR